MLRASDYKFSQISKDFIDSYLESVARNAKKIFIHVYDSKNQRTEKTFEQFHQDVTCFRQYLLQQKSDQNIFATFSKNTYKNAVMTVAALLSDMIVCPFNSDEETIRLSDKIRLLENQKILAFTDQEKEFPIKTFQYKEIPAEKSVLKKRTHNEMFYIFTSGSTGTSKVVRQPEDGVLANVDALISCHQLNYSKIVATCLPLYHVNCLEFSFLGTLLSGSELVLFESFNLLQICEAVKTHRVQILSLIPPILRSLNEAANRVNSNFSSVDYIVTAATSLPKNLAESLTRNFNFKIIQGYGLSETVNFSTLMPPSLSREENTYWLTNFETPSIGTAVKGNEVVILDEENNLLGSGQKGEIAMRGVQVMLGYLNSDASEFSSGYFRSGDLGQFVICENTGEAYYFILGRKKETVKRNGETIGLREVDQYVQNFLAAEKIAVAVGFANDFMGEGIACAVYGFSDDDSAKQDLIQRLQNNSDSPLKPRIILFTKTYPLTESGKPRRWIFQKNLEKYKSQRLGGALITFEEV